MESQVKPFKIVDSKNIQRTFYLIFPLPIADLLEFENLLPIRLPVQFIYRMTFPVSLTSTRSFFNGVPEGPRVT
jgi:hypothetical protein